MSVIYAGYASNLLERRFLRYVIGGVLAETGRDHIGCRDRSLPLFDTPLILPGTMYFATESTFWGGGRALYDPDLPGRTLARGWRVSEEQCLDVVAQEMRLLPGTFSLAEIPRSPGERVRLGDGHYETLVCAGHRDGVPVLTMAAPWSMADVELLAPAPAYYDLITEGLVETFRCSPERARDYLDSLPGCRETDGVVC